MSQNHLSSFHPEQNFIKILAVNVLGIALVMHV